MSSDLVHDFVYCGFKKKYVIVHGEVFVEPEMSRRRKDLVRDGGGRCGA